METESKIPNDLSDVSSVKASPNATGGGRARRSWRRHAIVGSVAFHIVVILGLIIWKFPGRGSDNPDVVDRRSATESMESEVGGDRGVNADAITIPSADDVPAEDINRSLEASIKAHAAMPTASNQSTLDQQTEILESISDAESVAAVNAKIGDAMQLPARAQFPAEVAPPGEFDFDTAQMHDVMRKEDGRGGYIYQTVLLDAEGRTMEVDLTASEGEVMYDAMQKIKQSPLIASIYRQLVMPMMDEMLRKEKKQQAVPPPDTVGPSFEETDPDQ